MKKFLTYLIVAAAGALCIHGATPRTSKSVKSEKQRTAREIVETQKKIKENQRQTKRKLEALNDLTGRIEMQKGEIDRLSVSLDSVNSDIIAVSDSIAALEKKSDQLRANLKKTLRSMRDRRKAVNNVTFVFSSQSFAKALKRIGYINELNRWRTRKINELRSGQEELQRQRDACMALRDRQAAVLANLDNAQKELREKQTKEQNMVAQLRKEGKNLNAVLSEKQKRARQLDRELDNIIAAEQRAAEERRKAAEKAAREKAEKEKAAKEKAAKEKAAKEKENKGQTPEKKPAEKSPEKPAPKPAQPKAEAPTGYAEAERKLTGSFEANRGRLLFPVAGQYRISGTFGRGSHKDLANIKVDNSGIDISVSPGTKARAVFDGTVSSVFFMQGYQNIVIVRHGEYLSVYAGIVNLAVKKGSPVKAGATIGTVFTDPQSDNETVLHFEIRHEREKLNPLQWVK